MTNEEPVAHWRIIMAAIFDSITAFFVFGYLVALVFGGVTENGFSVSGAPALLVIALIILYFWAGKRFLGGTLWKRILKVR